MGYETEYFPTTSSPPPPHFLIFLLELLSSSQDGKNQGIIFCSKVDCCEPPTEGHRGGGGPHIGPPHHLCPPEMRAQGRSAGDRASPSCRPWGEPWGAWGRRWSGWWGGWPGLWPGTQARRTHHITSLALPPGNLYNITLSHPASIFKTHRCHLLQVYLQHITVTSCRYLFDTSLYPPVGIFTTHHCHLLLPQRL